MDRRRGEKSKETPLVERSARYVETEDGWFFRTREGIVLGPYADQFDAELSASLLVAQLAQLDGEGDPSAVIQRFATDPANATVKEREPDQVKDLGKIRRRHKIRNATESFQKAWHAVVRLKATDTTQRSEST